MHPLLSHFSQPGETLQIALHALSQIYLQSLHLVGLAQQVQCPDLFGVVARPQPLLAVHTLKHHARLAQRSLCLLARLGRLDDLSGSISKVASDGRQPSWLFEHRPFAFVLERSESPFLPGEEGLDGGGAEFFWDFAQRLLLFDSHI